MAPDSFSLVPEFPSPGSSSLSHRVWGVLPDHCRWSCRGSSIHKELPTSCFHVPLSEWQSKSSLGPMCCAILSCSVPRAGAQQGAHPSLGPCLLGPNCLLELASSCARPKPWVVPASATPTCTGQRKYPRSQKSKQPRSEETKRVSFSVCLLFKSPLPKPHALQKLVGVSSFPTNKGQCWPYLPLSLFCLSCLAKGQSLEPGTLCINSLLLFCLRQSPSSGGPPFEGRSSCF